MGLDWMLYGRPAPGREEEFARLTATINRLEEKSCGDKEKKLLDTTARRRPIDEPELFALLAAVQWLRFWGSRGFGYDSWY